MLKSKLKIIAMFFIIFVISFLFINTNFAKNDNEVTKWNVTITNDAKEIKDTQRINFIASENKDVVKGKIAPGMKATAVIKINLVGTKVPVDILFTCDGFEKNESFDLIGKIDEEVIRPNDPYTIELEKNEVFTNENGDKTLEIELQWNSITNQNDTVIGVEEDTITLPITITVREHI